MAMSALARWAAWSRLDGEPAPLQLAVYEALAAAVEASATGGPFGFDPDAQVPGKRVGPAERQQRAVDHDDLGKIVASGVE